jgi:hypothetical protein
MGPRTDLNSVREEFFADFYNRTQILLSSNLKHSRYTEVTYLDFFYYIPSYYNKFIISWLVDPLLGNYRETNSGQSANGLDGKWCFIRGPRRWMRTQQWAQQYSREPQESRTRDDCTGDGQHKL